MSKSRGTFITAQQYLTALPAEYLRYYYAAKLSNQVEDIDFNLSDFTARINADLVGKYVNLASRCAGFITKKFAGKLSDGLHNKNLFQQFIDAHESIFTAYETLQFNRTTREIMALCDVANQYVDHHKPWALAKEPDREKEVQQVCTQALNLFRLLTIYLMPILPITANKVAEFLNTELTFESLSKPLLNHTINAFTPLMQRITEQQIESLVHHESDD
jgi:methionyl-tRNA synthetase